MTFHSKFALSEISHLFGAAIAYMKGQTLGRWGINSEEMTFPISTEHLMIVGRSVRRWNAHNKGCWVDTTLRVNFLSFTILSNLPFWDGPF
jgi:hypothetical protein